MMLKFSTSATKNGFLGGIGLHLRLVLAGAITTFLAVTLVCWFLVNRQATILHGEIVRSTTELRHALIERGALLADSMALSMENAIAGYNFTFVHASLRSVAESTPDLSYGFVTNNAGVVIVHTDPERVGSTLTSPLAESGTVMTDVSSGTQVVEIYHPINVGGSIWGNLVLGFGLDAIEKRSAEASIRGQQIMLKATRAAVTFAGVATLLGLIVSVLLSRRLLQPIRRLAHDAEAIASGNLNREISVLDSDDEIGFLGHQFEMMRRSIKTYIGELVVAKDRAEAATHEEKRLRGQIEEHSRLLELKVQERTKELREINTRLTENDRLKTEFLSNVSHELRSPLAAIGSASKIIWRYGDDENKRTGKKFSQVIMDESDRLGRLINDLLDLAKIEAGRVEWNMEELEDPFDLLGQVVTTFKPLADESGVALELECARGLPGIIGDRDRLVQVLTNLLSNAMKFTPAGGQILVSGQRHLHHGQDSVLIAVQDSGPGIPEDELEKVFDRFHQVKAKKKSIDKPKGTGLGLAICREVVSYHGGEIWAEKAPGGGARMVFYLPAAPETKPSTSDNPQAPSPQPV